MPLLTSSFSWLGYDLVPSEEKPREQVGLNIGNSAIPPSIQLNDEIQAALRKRHKVSHGGVT